jgi:hypothetical protein
MTPPQKPEWFQLVESDGGKPRKNVKRGFRALALSIPLLAIGIGVVVAQTSNESPASAETTSAAATQSPIVTTAPVTTAPDAPKIVAPKIVAAPTKSNQPSIAQPPSAPSGGEDDDEYENEGDDD